MAYPPGCEGAYWTGRHHGYLDGYSKGREAGYVDGYNKGYQDGYERGYREGHEEGYRQGYRAGYLRMRDRCKADILDKVDPVQLVDAVSKEGGLVSALVTLYERVVDVLEGDKLAVRVLEKALSLASEGLKKEAVIMLRAAQLWKMLNIYDPSKEYTIGSPPASVAKRVKVEDEEIAEIALPLIPVAKYRGHNCTPPTSKQLYRAIADNTGATVYKAKILAEFTKYLRLLVPEYRQLPEEEAAKIFVKRVTEQISRIIEQLCWKLATTLEPITTRACRDHKARYQHLLSVANTSLKHIASVAARYSHMFNISIEGPVAHLETTVWSNGRVERTEDHASAVVKVRRLYHEEKGVKATLAMMVSKKKRLEARQRRQMEQELLNELRQAATRAKREAAERGVHLNIEIETDW